MSSSYTAKHRAVEKNLRARPPISYRPVMFHFARIWIPASEREHERGGSSIERSITATVRWGGKGPRARESGAARKPRAPGRQNDQKANFIHYFHFNATVSQFMGGPGFMRARIRTTGPNLAGAGPTAQPTNRLVRFPSIRSFRPSVRPTDRPTDHPRVHPVCTTRGVRASARVRRVSARNRPG